MRRFNHAVRPLMGSLTHRPKASYYLKEVMQAKMLLLVLLFAIDDAYLLLVNIQSSARGLQQNIGCKDRVVRYIPPSEVE